MIKCANCNQFIDGKDKFCKYCGCPTPAYEESEKFVEKPKTEKQILDEIQMEKTIVTEDNINCAAEIDYALLDYKIIGDRNSAKVRHIIIMAISVIVAVTCLALCFLFKSLTNQVFSVIGLMASIVFMFLGTAIAAERFNNINMLSRLVDRKIFIPRYGLKKTPIFLLGGSIFKLIIKSECPICDGEIKGDLHVEIIEDRPVAICNYNRKHLYFIAEQLLFDRIVGIGTSSPTQADNGSDMAASNDINVVDSSANSDLPADIAATACNSNATDMVANNDSTADVCATASGDSASNILSSSDIDIN